MPGHVDPLRVALQVGLYIFFYILFLTFFAISGFATVLGLFAGSALSVFISGVATNILTLRIYEGRKLADIGFHWNPTSAHNLVWGLAGGVASALLVLGSPLAVHAASLQPGSVEAHWRVFVWVMIMLIFGAAGEEVLFRGYGFQVLLRSVGPFATILPVGVLFGLLHAFNPHPTTVSVLNTAGFGILFGYAFLRSRDLWLPFGLHFGWNFTLPLFGADVSGIKIGVTGYEMHWNAGVLWSGGDYGPEASLLCSGVLVALFAFIWKAPIRPQRNLLLDEPVEK
ncbi:MAG TPA: type II CAAX endopeptidase family protein [Bryobacteraceae bacterium]|nr:type II CAAX endopeptidase family protein [Bryobacteraceae bacterium]